MLGAGAAAGAFKYLRIWLLAGADSSRLLAAGKSLSLLRLALLTALWLLRPNEVEQQSENLCIISCRASYLSCMNVVVYIVASRGWDLGSYTS